MAKEKQRANEDRDDLDLGAVLGPGRTFVRIPGKAGVEILHPTELSTAQFSRVVRLWGKRDKLSRQLGLIGEDSEFKDDLSDDQYDAMAAEVERVEAKVLQIICDGNTSDIPPMMREVVASCFFETRAEMAKRVQDRSPMLTRAIQAQDRARRKST